jgi:CheY-like chemotaxis protein
MTRILLVDDVDLFLELERTFLKRFGCEILIAKAGDEALERVRRQRPDAILLDAVMPGMDGYETCRVLKQDPETRDIPVIFVAADPDLRRMAEAGGDDLVAKPIRREALLEVLRRHVPIVERGADRVPVNLRVQIDDDPRTLFSKDLSKEGIFLKRVPPLPIGRRVGMRFRLPLPEGPEEVRVTGEVVRQVPEDPGSHLIPGVGVRFVDPPASARASVSRFIRARLADRDA